MKIEASEDLRLYGKKSCSERKGEAVVIESKKTSDLKRGI